MEVYTFRIVLILLGGGLIFGLLVWDRWRRAKRRKERIEPSLGSEEDLLRSGMDIPDQRWDLPEELQAGANEPTISPSEEAAPAEMIVQFRVVARTGTDFSGRDVQAALQEQAMVHGAMQLFHRYSDGSAESPLFSVAGLVEPGYFEPDSMAQKTYPGLVLFMRLPGPQDGIGGFRELLQTVHSLAHRLGGNMQDAEGQPLEQKTLERIQQEIGAFQCAKSREKVSA